MLQSGINFHKTYSIIGYNIIYVMILVKFNYFSATIKYQTTTLK